MDITHLLHWNHAESFTPTQVACLIRGLDPSNKDECGEGKISHILDSMRKAYVYARGCCARLMAEGGPGYSKDRPAEFPLFSIDLKEAEKQNLHKACFFGNAADKLDWLAGDGNPLRDFDNQHFYAYQVAEWLEGSRTHSVYPFNAVFVEHRGGYVDESQIQPARLLSPAEMLALSTPPPVAEVSTRAAPASASNVPACPIKAPVIPISAQGDDAWKERALKKANEIITRQKAKDLYPSQTAIADEIARVFREADIVGASGKPLSGAYIKRHALKGISSAQNRQLSTSIRRGK